MGFTVRIMTSLVIVLMSVKTHCQLLIGMKNQIFQKIENHEPELEEKCLKKISS